MISSIQIHIQSKISIITPMTMNFINPKMSIRDTPKIVLNLEMFTTKILIMINQNNL